MAVVWGTTGTTGGAGATVVAGTAAPQIEANVAPDGGSGMGFAPPVYRQPSTVPAAGR